jgi:hypothetical protein
MVLSLTVKGAEFHFFLFFFVVFFVFFGDEKFMAMPLHAQIGCFSVPYFVMGNVGRKILHRIEN